MSADRPVSEVVTDAVVRAYCAAHDAYFAGPPPEDNDPDSGVRAGLEAVVPLIRARLAAEFAAPAPIDGLRPKVGEALAAATQVDIVWTRPLEVAPRPPVITPVLPSPSYGSPVTYTATEGFYEDDEPVVDYGTPGPSDIDSVAYASGGGFRSVGVDFEPDEPAADVAAAFDAADKGVTKRPACKCPANVYHCHHVGDSDA